MDNHFFTKQDIIDYMNETNKESAYFVLLCAGPDCFETYEEYEELENLLKN